MRVAGFVAAPLAAADAVLVDDEKELGVLLLDFGAQSIGYALFKNGRLNGCGGSFIGGNAITHELAQSFSTPLAHAERQKILHGTTLSTAGDENRFIDIKPLTRDDEQSRISRAEMTSVIVTRLECLYETVLKQVVDDRCPVRDLRRLVLTGGGSQLDGARSHAERVFSMKARLGRPTDVAGTPEALTGPSFSAAIGALRVVAHTYEPDSDFPETESDARAQAGASGHQGTGVVSWLRSRF